MASRTRAACSIECSAVPSGSRSTTGTRFLMVSRERPSQTASASRSHSHPMPESGRLTYTALTSTTGSAATAARPGAVAAVDTGCTRRRGPGGPPSTRPRSSPCRSTSPALRGPGVADDDLREAPTEDAGVGRGAGRPGRPVDLVAGRQGADAVADGVAVGLAAGADAGVRADRVGGDARPVQHDL